MGCLLYPSKLQQSPYSEFFLPSLWDDFIKLFSRSACRARAIASEDPLQTMYVYITTLTYLPSTQITFSRCRVQFRLQVSYSALPVIKKMTILKQQKDPTWNIAASNELPVFLRQLQCTQTITGPLHLSTNRMSSTNSVNTSSSGRS